MDTFLLQYLTNCEKIALPLGFSQKRSVFIRVVNDVCQSFYVEKLRRGLTENICRISFSVLPLCQGISREEIEESLGAYFLRKFEISNGEEFDGWRYGLKSESISACIDEIMLYLRIYLVPFFEHANCTKTAFYELIALEKLFNEIRVEGLRLQGAEGCVGPGAGLNLCDNAKYYMALKNSNYDYAKKSRNALLEKSIASYESVKSFASEKSLSKRKKTIQQLQKEVALFETGDTEYFQRLVEKNESYSRESLKRYIC